VEPQSSGPGAKWGRIIFLYDVKTKEFFMRTAKEKIAEVVMAQPEDATYEEIVRELAFERMVERGMNDTRSGRVISDEEMSRRIRTWQS
jgi:predicted transcriptional regulator